MKVLRDKTPVARKEHRCNFCGGVNFRWRKIQQTDQCL